MYVFTQLRASVNVFGGGGAIHFCQLID